MYLFKKIICILINIKFIFFLVKIIYLEKKKKKQ